MNFIAQRIYDWRTMAQQLLYSNQKPTTVFPKFKSISFEDKSIIEEFTGRYLPYSDFNFTSVYTWNVHNQHAYSLDGDNLILKLADYVTGNPVYTVLGTSKTEQTFQKLIAFCKTDNTATIKLVPETTIHSLVKNTDLKIIEDTNNCDYVFSLQELSLLQGGKFKNKRHAANKCEREANISFRCVTTASPEEILQVQKLISQWEAEKAEQGKNDNESETELQALQRVFTHFNDQDELMLSLAYQSGTLVGFSVDECLHNKYVVSHYFKALPSIPGLSEHFNRYVASELLNKGYEHWNWEQDLGIIELRQMKLGYRPVTMLKKFETRF